MRVFNKNYEEQIKSYEEKIKSYEEQIGRQQKFFQDHQERLHHEQRCRQAFQSELTELKEKYALLLTNHISMMEKFRNHLSITEKYISITSETLNKSEGAR